MYCCAPIVSLAQPIASYLQAIDPQERVLQTFSVLEYRVAEMRRFFLVIGSVLLGCSAFSGGAQLRQDAEPAQPVRYHLEGTVVNAITGQPIARALVEVSGVGALLTGPDGHFQMSGSLAAGTRMAAEISATKPGFYQRRPGYNYGSGLSAVSPGDDQYVAIGPDSANMLVIKLALTPASVITGTVQDFDGDAVEGVTVKAVQSVILEGRKRWQQVAMVSTDEDGHFRMANLQAGRYYVAVLPGSYRRSLADFSKGQITGYPAAVYYPASADRASALPLDLKPGEKLELPFELRKVPAFKVSGSLVGATNVAYVPVQLTNDEGTDIYFSASYKRDSTEFEFYAVPAGHYVLRAANGYHAEVALNVERNITDLSLAWHAAISVPVTLRTEFSRSDPSLPMQTGKPALGLLSVIFHDVGADQEDVRHGLDVAKDGSLQLKDLSPGRYLLEFKPILGYVYSARCGGTDLLREPLTISDSMPPIEVTLRDNTGSLTVDLDSAEPHSRATLLVVSDAPGISPTFVPLPDRAEITLPNMAPGQYSVFAFDAIDQIEYRNPDVVDQYAARASHVTVAPGNNAKASVEVIHTAE
jgi:hypothetical protein